MSEPVEEKTTSEESHTDKWPGKIDDYRSLRTAAKNAANNNDPAAVGLAVAAQLAGLAYILDGIRFTARQN